MAKNKHIDTEKYQGMSKVGGMLGGASVWGFIALPVTFGIQLLGKGGTRTQIAAGAVSLAATIYGGFTGWSKAAHGKQQFESLKTERDEARGQLGQVAQVLQSAEPGAAKFAEGMAPRGAHGSHADAVLAEKALAAQAQTAR